MRHIQSSSDNSNRKQLLAVLPVSERYYSLSGITTPVLEGGHGRDIILLHGPGESAVWWMRIITELVKTHHVNIPDLPGHGASLINGISLDKDRVIQWLDELIKQTCTGKPVLTGHILGGSLALRYTIEHEERLHKLVVVDSLGLDKFRPAPNFAYKLLRFMIKPSKKAFDSFLNQCFYDPTSLQRQMGTLWEPFLTYNLECSQAPGAKTALRKLMTQVGIPRIPPDKLEQISIPTSLIWGRYDRANRLQIAKNVSKQYGWPLHIIEDTRDDPKLEQPEAFLKALYASLNETQHSEDTSSISNEAAKQI